MKVYFIAPQKDIELHGTNYKEAQKLILESGSMLSNKWDISKSIQSQKGYKMPNSSRYYQSSLREINNSDVVIFDATVSSMSIGHQMTYALNMQKPTLIMVNQKYKKVQDLFIAGSESTFLNLAVYSNKQDLKKIIDSFINSNKDLKKSRLNLVLTKSQNNYLNWASNITKKTKTEVVHRALDRMIRSDEEYQAFKDSKL